MKKLIFLLIPMISIVLSSCFSKKIEDVHEGSNSHLSEAYRPTIHFTPTAHWMNDPNGMVYYKGEYHLFYQYYPEATVWGPMYWGHAVSKDLVHWEHLPIALYPDSLGYIFSGSAVVDYNNTSGLKSGTEDVMVAIFTYHNPKNNIQSQGIAYSNDKGRTWVKYDKNPVLKNPGIPDFRDPKVCWLESQKKWILTLAAGQKVNFYSSSNLKDWAFESSFGEGVGAHGGVWECPDLFPMKMDSTGSTKWVLLVNINPGGPNGGSACQYFVGDFDGKIFTPTESSSNPQWLDYGRDHYAAVTWSNMPETDGRRISIAWMNNWQYAEKIPTKSWRGGTTLPRELTLTLMNGKYLITTKVIGEFDILNSQETSYAEISVDGGSKINKIFPTGNEGAYKLLIGIEPMNSDSVQIVLENSVNENFRIIVKPSENKLFIDRSHSGVTSFEPSFKNIISAPLEKKRLYTFTIYVDKCSVEVFEGDGEIALTNLCFPSTVYRNLSFVSSNQCSVKYVKAYRLKSAFAN